MWSMSRDFFGSSSSSLCSISSWYCNNRPPQEVFDPMNSSSRPSDDDQSSTASDPRHVILQDLESSQAWNQDYMIFNNERPKELTYSDISREAINSRTINYWQQTTLMDCPHEKAHQSPSSHTYPNNNVALQSSPLYIYDSDAYLLQSLLETADDTQQQQITLLENNSEMKNYSSDFPLTGGKRQPSSVFFPLSHHREITEVNQKNDRGERGADLGANKAVHHEPEMSKRPRLETPSPLPTFKVRKEKLGDRVTALQQLVSPFGKTDTASVLHEAIEYIRFLHDQVSALSAPYLENRCPRLHHHREPTHQYHGNNDDQEGDKNQDLKSHGLCLVPISSTFALAAETSVDLWTKL